MLGDSIGGEDRRWLLLTYTAPKLPLPPQVHCTSSCFCYRRLGSHYLSPGSPRCREDGKGSMEEMRVRWHAGRLTLKFTFWMTCWGSLSRITLQGERNQEEHG